MLSFLVYYTSCVYMMLVLENGDDYALPVVELSVCLIHFSLHVSLHCCQILLTHTLSLTISILIKDMYNSYISPSHD